MIRKFVMMSIFVFAVLQIKLGVADTDTGIWKTGSPAPSKRTEVAAAALKQRIYVAGGFNRPGLGNLLDFAISRDVEIYDPETNSWSTTTPLPEGRHHAGMVAHDGFLYVIGGFAKSGFSVWHAVDTVYQFNPEAQTWRERAAMPTARGALGVTVYQGKIYAIGGYDGNQNAAAVEVYDPETNTWEIVSPLSAPRDHLAVAAAGSGIYAIGGRSNLKYKQNTSVVERYDPDTDQWQYVASLPVARSGMASGVINGEIYVLGGESGEGTFDTNEKYLPGENRWVTLAPMPTARHGLGVAVIGERLYAIGGGPSPGASFGRITEIFNPRKK